MINQILLIVVGIIYVCVAVCYLFQGKLGLAITFIAYAVANYGLYVAGK